MCREYKTVKHSILNGMCLSNFSAQGSVLRAQGSGSSVEEDTERLQEPEGMDDIKGTVSDRHNITSTQMNSQRLW